MSEQEQEREHKSGKSYGYETDGTSYWLAPGLVERWGEIQDQDRALEATLEAVVRGIADARRYVEKQRRKWWETVYDDLGLDQSIAYTFRRPEGKLSPVAVDREPDEPHDEKGEK